MLHILTFPVEVMRGRMKFLTQYLDNHLRSRRMFYIPYLLLRFETTVLQRRLVSKNEAKFRTLRCRKN